MKTVAIYSKQTILAFGLQSILAKAFTVAGIFDSIESIGQLLRDAAPDILVVDHDQSTNIKTLQEMRSLSAARIVVWVDSLSTEFFTQCLAAGMAAILTKLSSPETHVRCIAEVAQGNIWVDHSVIDKLPTTRQVHLTPRERDLMGLLVQGLSNKDVAWALKITEGTVKVYLSRLFDKLGVVDRFDLALLGLRNLTGSIVVCNERHSNAAPVPVSFPSLICIQKRELVPETIAVRKLEPGRAIASVSSGSYLSCESLAG